jgi:hypothetical protein
MNVVIKNKIDDNTTELCLTFDELTNLVGIINSQDINLEDWRAALQLYKGLKYDSSVTYKRQSFFGPGRNTGPLLDLVKTLIKKIANTETILELPVGVQKLMIINQLFITGNPEIIVLIETNIMNAVENLAMSELTLS